MNLHLLISFTYFLSSIFYIGHLWTQKKKVNQIGFLFGLLAITVHSIYIVMFLIKGASIAGGLGKSLFLFSWFISITFVISRTKFKISAIGAFVFPFAFICTVPSLIIPSGLLNNDNTLNNPLVLIHIILIFLGEAFFTIAFIAGCFYLFEENSIKTKRISSILKKIPSLSTLDNINHTSLLIGFPLVTLGLALGFFLANQIWGELWHWSTKEYWSLLTWLLYAILINGRLSLGWKGKKSAIGAVIGFSIILLTFFVGYLIPGMHTFN